MRLPTSLYARRMPMEPVAFQEMLPLKLKNSVSGKGEKTSEVCCIYEMSIMFACFKDNDFNQSLCSKEIDNFQKCYMHHLKTKKLKEEAEAKGIIAPGERKMTHKQINNFMKRFPL